MTIKTTEKYDSNGKLIEKIVEIHNDEVVFQPSFVPVPYYPASPIPYPQPYFTDQIVTCGNVCDSQAGANMCLTLGQVQ